MRGGRVAPRMRVGTASARGGGPVLALEPSLSIEPLRGNIDTGLRKRGERGLDAVVLAACGLDRLGLDDEIGLRFDPGGLLPEAGQERWLCRFARGSRSSVARGRRRRDAPPGRSRACVRRSDRRRLPGPIAAYHDGETLTALVADPDGRWLERRSGDDPTALAAELRPLAAA